jgi:hypothetical protein
MRDVNATFADLPGIPRGLEHQRRMKISPQRKRGTQRESKESSVISVRSVANFEGSIIVSVPTRVDPHPIINRSTSNG